MFTSSLAVASLDERMREVQSTVRFLQLKAANATADNRNFISQLVLRTHAVALRKLLVRTAFALVSR